MFGRKKKAPSTPTVDETTTAAEEFLDDDVTAADAPTGRGPFDESQVSHLEGRIDFGSLCLRAIPGLALRLEVDQASNEITSVHAGLGDSALQLQAFAAPKDEGVWDEIRADISTAVVGAGGTAEETEGPFGAELLTRMPSAGPDGRTVFAPVRFIGVDGPRWFLRGVLSGEAAVREEAAEPLLGIIESAVVRRGVGPMAPRELLPLRVPQTAQTAQPGQPQGQQTPAAPPTDEAAGDADLNPFERGPEITEVR